MKFGHTLWMIFLVCFSTQYFSQASCSYAYRKRITFDPVKVAGPIDLVNFPALISIIADNDLRTTTNSGHVENTNGFDIIFTAGDGVTLLNFQLEKYTATSGQLTAWVKVPLMSTSINTDIYMYYGNTAITTDQSSTTTWSAYYAVWHFQNNSFTDSSPNAYGLTNNSTTNQSPAIVNDGRADDGTQWLESSSFPDLTTNFSISGWAYTNNNSAGGQRIFCDDVNNSGGYALSIGDAGTGQLRFYSRSASTVLLDSPANTILNNTWYYCVGVADMTNGIRSIYVNGVLVGSVTSTGWGTDSGNSSAAGETASGETGNRLNGRIDEVRIANVALSADWIATEYANQNSPSTFYTISAEPKVWLGGTSILDNTSTNWLNNSPPAGGEDVIVTNGSFQPTLQGNRQLNSLFVKPGATISLSSFSLAMRSDVTNCGTIAGNTGIVILNSAATNVQTQYVSGSGTNNFTDFVINNVFSPTPKIVLNKDVNVSGALSLGSGIVFTTATNILALGTSATSTSGSANSFVSGPMTKTGTADFVFPTGKGSRWRRTSLTNISSSTTYRAEYFNTAYTSTTPANSPLNHVSSLEYWQVDQVTGTGNANLALYWEDATVSGINNCADLTIARYNGSSWDERPGTTSGPSSCSGTGTGTVTSTAAITAFSPFTFASITSSNPLPIVLLKLEAVCLGNELLVSWSTVSENQNDHFILERSHNGTDWAEIAQIKGAGTSNTKHDYLFRDANKDQEIVYYKLSQVDIDGKKESFDVISINCGIGEEELLIYPNPASRELNLKFKLSQNYGSGAVKIIDGLGKTCLQKTMELQKGTSTFVVPLTLEQGSYVVLFSSEHLVIPAHKLIVK